MRPLARSLLALLLLTVVGTRSSAQAQVDSREGIALQNQIYQLRQELKSLEDQNARGAPSRGPAYAPPPQQYGGGSDLVAQLLTRVDQLEDQVRQLRGRIDETQNELQRQTTELSKRIDDVAFQANPQGSFPRAGSQPSLGNPPAGASPAAASQPPARPPSTPPPVPRPSGPVNRTPELVLQEASAALSRRDYQTAEAAAREVLANRTSPRAYDAQLLLAEALSGERQYAQAAIAFDDSYNRSRKGTHAQDALAGLARSLAAINEKKAACDTLARLRTEFPQVRPDIQDNIVATVQKAGCH